MPKFSCNKCGFFTNRKADFERHLKTKKHLGNTKVTQINEPSNTNQEFSNTEVTQTNKTEKLIDNDTGMIICEKCNKQFKHHNSYYRHRKKYCKGSDLFTKETNAIIIKTNDKEIQMLKTEIEKLTTHCIELQKINEENKMIIAESGITPVSNSMINANNQIHNHNNYVAGDAGMINNGTVNINIINDYKNTNYDKLQDSDYLNCFLENNYCVKKLIETVHFDENSPENNNIYISAIKGKYIMVYKEGKWELNDRKYYIDDLYDSNELILENWYDIGKEKYPQIIKSFERYLTAKEDNEYMNKIKRDIVLMLYNNRSSIVKKN